MVRHVLPVGVRGIVVAGLLSALMSSLAGVVQRLLDAVHDGFLQEAPAQRVAAPVGLDRPRGHGRHGADRRCCGSR